MKVIVWNMAGGYGYETQRHDAAWRYLHQLDPDIALLQEAVPPAWAVERWPGLVAAQKYPGSKIPWGSAVIAKSALEPAMPTTEANRRPYQLDHVFADERTRAEATSWKIIPEPAAELRLSDHAPIEVLISSDLAAEVPEVRPEPPPRPTNVPTDRPSRPSRSRRRPPGAGHDRDGIQRLVAKGVLAVGDVLWLRKEAMARKRWDLYDPDLPMFRAEIVQGENGEVLLRWRASTTAGPELIHPTDMTFRVYQERRNEMPDWNGKPFKPYKLLTCFSLGREGPPLNVIEERFKRSDGV